MEDNKDVKNVAVSLLEQLGYKTIAVESASEALDVLASGQTVNLVFTDVALPGQLDGLALARKVTDRYGAIPIVLTTGYTRAFDSDPEFPVLRKPYQISALGRADPPGALCAFERRYALDDHANPGGPASTAPITHAAG